MPAPEAEIESEMDLEQLLLSYGYPIIFLVTFLEGETIVIIAGFLASRGYLDLWGVIAAAFFGSTFGDQLYFYIGRTQGGKLLKKKPQWREKADRAIKLLHRYQNLLIVSYRFLYGIRIVTPFVIGASGIKPMRHLILNMVGAAIWASSFAYAGSMLGDTLQKILKKYEKTAMAVIVGTIALVWLYSKWSKRRKRDKRVESAE